MRAIRQPRLPTALIRSAVLALPWFLSSCAANRTFDEESLPIFARVPLRESTVIDQRRQFADTFCRIIANTRGADSECNRYLHLPASADARSAPSGATGSTTSAKVIFVPGLLGECIADTARVFGTSRDALEQLGHLTYEIPVSGRGSAQHNAQQVAAFLRELATTDQDHVIVLGYSKGVVDTLEALVSHPDAFRHVDALVSVAGAVAGSPAADQTGRLLRRLLGRAPLRNCPQGVGDGIASVSYAERMRWLEENPLPSTVAYFSIAAFAATRNVSRALRPSHRALSRIDVRNDGQVIHHDALIPSGALLGFLNADHWAVALPIPESRKLLRFFANKNDYPRTELLLAIVEHVGQSLAGADVAKRQSPIRKGQ